MQRQLIHTWQQGTLFPAESGRQVAGSSTLQDSLRSGRYPVPVTQASTSTPLCQAMLAASIVPDCCQLPGGHRETGSALSLGAPAGPN